MTENEIGKIIVDSAITVHRELGPGLLETVYEVVLAYELKQRGLSGADRNPLQDDEVRRGVPSRHCGRKDSDHRAEIR